MAVDLTQRQADQLRFLRTLLAWHDINQAQLGDIIGCGQTNASRKLSGKRKLTVEELLLIADHLGIEPGHLINPPPLDEVLGSVRQPALDLVTSTKYQLCRSERLKLLSRLDQDLRKVA